MANPSKNKGTAAETAVVRWARDNGYPGADRQPLRGNRDAGDIDLCPGIVLEVKNHKTAGTGQPAPLVLAHWMAQAEFERYNAGAAHCPLVVKRAGTSDPGRWFAYLKARDVAVLMGAPLNVADPDAPWCTSLASLVQLLRHAGFGSPLAEESLTEALA
jgi:hypothetical protein